MGLRNRAPRVGPGRPGRHARHKLQPRRMARRRPTRRTYSPGCPHALYLPRRTSFTVTAAADCEFAVASVPADQDFPPRLVTPATSASKSAAATTPPARSTAFCRRAFPASGWSWSRSTRRAATGPATRPTSTTSTGSDADGSLLEADLDEIYYYKIDRPEGYALQRIYTDAELAPAPGRLSHRRRGHARATTMWCWCPRDTTRSPARLATPPTT